MHTSVPAPRRALPSVRASLALALMLALLATMLPVFPAHAAITTPQPGEVVSGIVEIHEDRGGNNGSGLLAGDCNGAYTRIEVYRVANGLTVEPPVFEVTRPNPVAGGGNDPHTYLWDSIGEPNGEYRIRSITADRSAGLFSCNALSAEVVRSDFRVTLENWIGGALRVPASHFTGEPLPVLVTSQDAAGNVVGGQQVVVEVDGVGDQTVTTDSDGEGSLSFDLPDLPAGPLTVTATTIIDDPAFEPSTTTATTELLHRPTTVTWTGDVRGFPGDDATLQARVTDATPGSARAGDPVEGLDVTITFGDDAETVTTDADGRATRTVALRGESREVPTTASSAGTDVYGPGHRQITFFVGDDAAIDSPTHHSLVGGLTRLVGSALTNPNTALRSLTTYLDSLLVPTGIEVGHAPNLPILRPVGDVIEDAVGPVIDDVVKLGDVVDLVLDELLSVLGAGVPPLGDLLDTLEFEWQAVYVTPEGDRVRNSFGAVMGVPEPLDITGDERADVVANLTLLPGGSGDLPFVPVLRVDRLGNAPADLPLSLQAVLGGGLIQVNGEDGRLRFGYDTRHSNAPNRFRADLILGDGAFDIDVRTRGGDDLTVTGALEGDGMSMPFGAATPTEGPSFDSPVTASEVEAGETRFGIGFAPAPNRARIGLGLGSGSGDFGVTFDTTQPTVIGVDFVSDSGADEVSILGAVFDEVDGPLALSLAGSESGGDSVAPDLGLQLQSATGLDRLAVQARSLAGGQVTDDLMLSLTDVPRSIVFGVGDDGALGLTASEPVGVMEAGFASGGPISTLDDPSFLYMTSDDNYQSVGLRLLGVESLQVALSDTIGLELKMAPGPLRAFVDSGDMGLDARIYDAPHELLLGLAAEGDFLIDGSAPIDLITLTVSDSSGILMGATSIDARIEDIRSRLSVGLVGEGVSFDAGDHPIGLLDLFATSGPQPVLPEGQDGLILNLSDDAFVMAARIHGLRNITADLDLESGSPSFGIDTVSNAIFNLDLSIAGIEIAGVIDHLVPNMSMGVAADEDGNLSGLKYEASRATNSISFNIPGFANFTANNPLPASFEMGVAGEGIVIKASEEFTLNLAAEMAGIEANITNLRSRVMEFGAGDLGGEYIPFTVNTTEWSDDCPDGCMYPIPSGTVRLGPIPLGGLNAFVNFTPGGIAARDATVYMELDESGLIPSAHHVETVGELYCTPQTNLNATVQILITITIQMRDALCGGSSTQSNMSIASLDAPTAVRTGDDVVHTLTARNAGPTPAANLQIDATHNGALGDPTVSCPGGGTVSHPDENAIRCVWTANTAANATRVMTLTWPTDEETEDGTRLEVDYLVSSTTAGSPAEASAFTVVSDTVAILGLLSIDAPETVVAGYEDIQHRIDARNDGPSAAEDMRIDATSNDVLGAPTVTCSEDGVVDGDACLWPGATDAGVERWAAFVWEAPDGSGGTVLEAEYVVSSATAGGGATATAATAVEDERADLEVVEASAPERSAPDAEIVHEVVTRNAGPSAADAMRILADYDPAYGVPDASCSEGGVVSAFPEINRVRCLWLGASPAGSERTIELRWSPESAEYGDTVGASFRVTSNTAGADARTTTRTLIADEPPPTEADLEIVSLTAPELWAPGANLVHRIDVRNAGPDAAANLRVLASYGDALGNPTVACSTGGTATQRVDDESVARCAWSADTAAGAARFLTLTWTNAQVTNAYNAHDPEDGDLVVDIDYVVSSDTDGEPAEASVSTEILAAVANLFVQTSTGPSGVLPGSALTHSVGIRRGGPSSATDLAVTGTFDADVTPATITCSTGGTLTFDTEVPNERTCTWAGVTSGTTTRTMTFTWTAAQTADMEPGTVVASEFLATSDTPGDTATFTPSTEILEVIANLNLQTSTGPATVLRGSALTHAAGIRNAGPAAATNLVVDGTYDEELAAPATISCSTGGVLTTPDPDAPHERRCTWAGNTSGTTTRTMTFTWSAAQTAELEPGTEVASSFVASSDTPGDGVEFHPTTEVTEPFAQLSIQSVQGPGQVTAGEGSVIQRIDARNDGPQAANPMQLLAAHDGSLGDPTVTCSSGGTATVSVDEEPVARCQWGNTTSGTARSMTVTWPVPAEAEAGGFTVDWTATGAVPNGQIGEAGHIATTQIVAAPPVEPED